MPELSWRPIQGSSMVKAMAFDPQGRLDGLEEWPSFEYGDIYVELHNDRTYQFTRCTRELFLSVANAESVGTAVNKLLIGRATLPV